MQLRPYQQEGLDNLWSYFQNGGTGNPLLCWPTGCHAKGTMILMFDGSTKPVETIQVGDLLIGPDSQPRKVLKLARGRETMVKIIPTKGESFVVNLSHILSLKTTQEKGNFSNRSGKLQKGAIENIKVSEYLNKSKWFKHTRKLWRTGVDFYCEPELYMSPYNLGLFLGDGSYRVANVSLASMDEEILNSFKNEAIVKGDIVRIENTKSKAKQLIIRRSKTDAKSYRSEFVEILTYLGLQDKLSEDKFIPIDYKINNRENRLQLLAGLIDTDGSLSGPSCYDYVSKSKRLATDVVYVARSLGLAAYIAECVKWDQNKAKGIYYRVSISGDISEIPVKLERKKAKPRLQKKDVLVTGFKTEILPEDDYYGFELDRDHLYLDGNFTIHHNTGKSIVPAIFIESIMRLWPTQRFLLLTHVKELIAQNSEVLKEVWPDAPLGIYSAGLKQKDAAMPIVYGGVQSAKNNPHLFGKRDLIFIDEAHLINQDAASMYLSFLSTMKLINPAVKIIGMTATPFRMGQGMITEGGIFTDIVHDLCSMDNFNRLIAEGYLAPLVPLRTKIELDVSNVGMAQGEFIQSQLQHAVDVAKVTYDGLRELVEAAKDRRSWLIFASGIEHAEHIAEMLMSFGIDCAAVHSKQSAEYNDKAIEAFKNYELRSIVNYGKLTTGFNHPGIDAIAMFRPTMSVPLWVQMLGRGTRPIKGKRDCLVLDYARNTPRLGPINDPLIPRKKGEAQGEVPVKICEFCGVFNHIKNKTCSHCGTEFSFEIKITKSAGHHELIKSDLPVIENFNVDRVIYTKHQKLDKAPCLKVTYFTGIRSFNEWLFPQSLKGPGRHNFHTWWRNRTAIPPPATVEEALLSTDALKVPRQIRVWVNRANPEIMSVEF